MNATISSLQVTELLDALYTDASDNDPIVRELEKEIIDSKENPSGLYMRKAYMPISRDFGNLLYSFVRSTKAQTVVEFGTSFGISTIFLAAALRDNGGGRLITTELHPEKAERARKNLIAAGLADYVEFRIGDVLDILAGEIPEKIDLLLLDGAKDLYFAVLKLVEKRLVTGSIVASDNTDREELAEFLKYLRAPDNGYISSAIVTEKLRGRGVHEISLRV